MNRHQVIIKLLKSYKCDLLTLYVAYKQNNELVNIN